MPFKVSTPWRDGGGLKFGGKRNVRRSGGLPGMITAGVLVAISVAGTWAVTEGGIAPGEPGRHGESTASEGRLDLWLNPADTGERLASGNVDRVSSRIQSTQVDGGEGDVFQNHPVSNPRAGMASVGEVSPGGWETNSSGIRGGERVFLVNGGRIHSREKSFLPPVSVANDSPASGVHQEAAAELFWLPLPGNGERAVPVSPGTAPWALITNQQGQGTPGSQGAKTEEPVQPGLVAGLLGVVAVAGALAGRYAGYPTGKRKDRK